MTKSHKSARISYQLVSKIYVKSIKCSEASLVPRKIIYGRHRHLYALGIRSSRHQALAKDQSLGKGQPTSWIVSPLLIMSSKCLWAALVYRYYDLVLVRALYGLQISRPLIGAPPSPLLRCGVGYSKGPECTPYTHMQHAQGQIDKPA